MKYLKLLFVLFVALNLNLKANSLQFCFSNDEKGNPDWQFTTITFNPYKTLRCLFKYDSIDYKKNNYVVFNVYFIDSLKNSELLNVYRLDIDINWEWFYYEMYFKAPGTYRIDITDEKEKLLASKQLNLLFY